MDTPRITRRRALTLASGVATVGLAGCVARGSDGPDPAETDQVAVDATYEAYVVTYHWGFAVYDENGEEFDSIEIERNTEVTLHLVNDHYEDTVLEELPDPVVDELEAFDALGRTKAKVEEGEIPEPDHKTIEAAYDRAHGRGGDDHNGDDDHGDSDDDHGDDDHGDDDHNGDDDHGDDDHGDDDHGDDDHNGDDDHGDDDHGDDVHNGDDDHGDDDHGDDDHGDDDHGDDDHGDDDHDHGHGDALLDHGFTIPSFNVHEEVPADAHEPITVSFVARTPGTYEGYCTVGCGYAHPYQGRELIRVVDSESTNEAR